ncbi:MAG: MFS transporter [Chitinophagaceae bacterium]|nr:MFS transporter [Chitinophagaceae bacterium]
MNWRPKPVLSETEVESGMKVMIVDGLASETMTTLTGGTFLVAMALLAGANNFEIGLLAGLPTATNILQLTSIWLCRRIQSKKLLCVSLSVSARIPLIIIGLLALTLEHFSFSIMISMLFFYYAFGSISGPIWNAWVKDLVPASRLGAYFSKRSRYMQMLNVILGLSVAFLLDHVKAYYTYFEQKTYGWMFIVAGIAGIAGAIYMGRSPEPAAAVSTGNMFALLRKPLKDINFRRLLSFNSLWLFAVNIAAPFFTVFMLKSVGLSLSFILILATISQVFSILTIRVWGKYADRFSNKNIIALGGPLYMLCLIAWCFVGLNQNELINYSLLFLIHACMGMANAGINLSLTNISLKLSPSSEAVIYLSARNIITSVFSAVAPIVGGLLVDFFSNRSLNVRIQWAGPATEKNIYLVHLHQWNFLFMIGAIIALISLEMLIGVKEKGEVKKDQVVRILRGNIKNTIKDYFIISQILSFHESIIEKIRKR